MGEAKRTTPQKLLTVVVCSISLSHPFSKKSRAKWNGHKLRRQKNLLTRDFCDFFSSSSQRTRRPKYRNAIRLNTLSSSSSSTFSSKLTTPPWGRTCVCLFERYHRIGVVVFGRRRRRRRREGMVSMIFLVFVVVFDAFLIKTPSISRFFRRLEGGCTCRRSIGHHHHFVFAVVKSAISTRRPLQEEPSRTEEDRELSRRARGARP